MVRALVLRGAGVGALAGLIAFVFARIFAEPVIQAAIDYEGGRARRRRRWPPRPGSPPSAEEPELFSRAVQGNLGIGVGMILFGVAIGLFFAVAFCMAYGRTGNVRPRQLSLLVGLFGFLAISDPVREVPGQPARGRQRRHHPRPRRALDPAWSSCRSWCSSSRWCWASGCRPGWAPGTPRWSPGAARVVVLGVVMALLPALGELSINVAESGSRLTETPQPLTDPSGKIVYPGFDPDLLYWFRLYSVGAQLLLWGVLAVGFAPLADRVLRSHGNPSQRDLAVRHLSACGTLGDDGTDGAERRDA